MVEAVLMSRFLGIVLLVMGVSLVVNRHAMKGSLDAVVHNAGLRLMAGIFPLFLGSYLIVFHNHWHTNAARLVAIFGWLCFAGGVFRTGAPLVWVSLVKRCERKEPFAVIGLIVALYGAAMLYFGYFAML